MTSTEWEPETLDLRGYLDRIGATPGPATGETLARLHLGHVENIPFENLDLVLGRGVAVDLPRVKAKLVERSRGGYCYEHATLFGAALERLGFRVVRLLARIGYDGQRPRPRTHMALRVSAQDGEWLADVGFGSGPRLPLRWSDGPSQQGVWDYRLVTDDTGTRRLQERHADRWSDLHSFTEAPQHASDMLMANHFTATHASSPFLGDVVAMRREEDRIVRLHGHTLDVRRPDGPAESRELTDPEVLTELTDRFRIGLTDGERAALSGLLRHSPS